MYRKKQSIMTLFMVLAFILGYQAVYAGHYQGSLTFNMGFPQGEFKENLDKNGLGVGLNFGVKMGSSPFIMGVDLNILNYGQDSRYESLYNIPDMVVKVVNSYNIFQGYFFLRYQPLTKSNIIPYLEALAGLNYLWAETSIEDDDWEEDDISSVNYDDTTFSYGFGAGMMISFGGRKHHRPKSRTVGFLLDVRARYLVGGKAEYLKEGSIVVDGQDVTYYISESKTDLLTFQVGFAIMFY